jgi:hypothetical protein
MRDLGGGHTALDRFNASRQGYGTGGEFDQSLIEGIARRIGSREEAEKLYAGGSPHIMVFPNLMLLINAFRIIQPVKHDLTYVYYYPLSLKGASDELNRRRLKAHEMSFGPAGFINPDDADMQTRQQIGSSARVNEERYMFLMRGKHEERLAPDEFGVPSLVSPQMNETTARGIWRHYKTVMSQS